MTDQTRLNALAALIDRYCEAWSDPSASRRAALLAEVWAPDATYTDPRVHATGAAELAAYIEQILARRPGAKVLRTSALDVHRGGARFAWHVVQADGSTLPEGLDIAEFTADGTRIARIVGFFGPLTPIRAPMGAA